MTLSILALSPTVFHAGMVALLVLGFGFVIFWHELGHFLAAKFVGIKVEQFAVGFGQALLAWRKGIGVRWGSTQREYQNWVERYLEENQLKSRDKVSVTDRQMSEAAERLDRKSVV